MKKLLALMTTVLVLLLSFPAMAQFEKQQNVTLDPYKNLKGWWKMEYKMFGFGSWVPFEDYVHIRGVRKNGTVFGETGWNEELEGWVNKDTVFVSWKAGYRMVHGYAWDWKEKKWAKHMAIQVGEYTHEVSWQEMKATKIVAPVTRRRGQGG